MAKEDGCRRSLTCGYHGWTFRLDGPLALARDAESDPGFCREALSLLPVAVDQWAQCVFVNTDPDAAPLRRAHPCLEPLAAQGGFDTDPERYRLHREAVADIAANWKLWYDNGVECYHCPAIHGESFAAAFDVSPERNVPILIDYLVNNFSVHAAARDGDTAQQPLLLLPALPRLPYHPAGRPADPGPHRSDRGAVVPLHRVLRRGA